MKKSKRGKDRKMKSKGTRPVKTKKLHLLNIKVDDATHALFKRVARNASNGNVSALLIAAVKTASMRRMRSHLKNSASR